MLLVPLPVNRDQAKYTVPSHEPPVRSASIAVLSLNTPRRFGADEPRFTISLPHEALAVVDRRAAGPARVVVDGDEDVAEGLLGPGRIVRRFRAHEHAAVAIPGDDRVARAGGPDVGLRGVGRGVVRVAGHERAPEARATVLAAVVAEPDRPDRRRRRAAGRLIDAAIIVGAADQQVRVARVDLDGRLVLAATGDAAFGERVVRVGVAGGQGVGADVAAADVVRQADVAGGEGAADHGHGCDHAESDGEGTPGSQRDH